MTLSSTSSIFSPVFAEILGASSAGIPMISSISCATRSGSADGRSILRAEQNLTGLRETAANLLGFQSASQVHKSDEIPAALAEFIKGRPRSNAFDDFALWDEMLIKAYGERKFITMDTDDGKIYGR